MPKQIDWVDDQTKHRMTPRRLAPEECFRFFHGQDGSWPKVGSARHYCFVTLIMLSSATRSINLL